MKLNVFEFGVVAGAIHIWMRLWCSDKEYLIFAFILCLWFRFWECDCACGWCCCFILPIFPDHFLHNLLYLVLQWTSLHHTYTHITHFECVRTFSCAFVRVCAYDICLFDVQQTIHMCYWYVLWQITKTTFCSFRSIIDLISGQIYMPFVCQALTLACRHSCSYAHSTPSIQYKMPTQFFVLNIYSIYSI